MTQLYVHFMNQQVYHGLLNVLKQKNQELLALCNNIQFSGAEAILIKPKLCPDRSLEPTLRVEVMYIPGK